MEESMKDLDRLAVLDPSRGREPSAMQWARSAAFIDRTISGAAGTRPEHSSRRRWMTAGAMAVAAGVVGAVAVPTLIPSAAERAIASWTPIPTARTGDQVLPQAQACGESKVGGASKVTAADVVLAEQRGEATMLILRKGDGLVECLTIGGDAVASMGLAPVSYKPDLPAGVAANVETQGALGEGDDQWSNIIGVAAPEVTGVDVRLPNGAVIQSSVKSGWWAAWWPGPEGGEVDALTVTVHTKDGSRSYPASQLVPRQ